MNKKGRTPLPPEQRLVEMHVRVPRDLLRWYDEQGVRSVAVRRALEQYKEANS